MQKFIQSLNNFKPIQFSIIIPCYKVEKYIEDCLDSIQNQTYFKYNDNYEILCGVDGDFESLKKINEIRHKYKNLRIFFGNNMGAATTRNTLTNFAKYNDIVSVDGDDCCCYNMFSVLANNISDDIGSIHFKRLYNFIDNNLNGKSVLYYYNNSIFPENIFHLKVDWDICGSLYFRKDLWKQIGGYCNYKLSEDVDFNLRLKYACKNKNHLLIKDRIYLRREHSGSLTQQKRWRYDNNKQLSEIRKKLSRRKYINNKIQLNNSMREINYSN